MAANQCDRSASRQRCWAPGRDQGRPLQRILRHSSFYWAALFYCAPERNSALRFGVLAGNVELHIWSESCFNTALYLYDPRASLLCSRLFSIAGPSQSVHFTRGLGLHPGWCGGLCCTGGIDAGPCDQSPEWYHALLHSARYEHVCLCVCNLMYILIHILYICLCVCMCNLMLPVRYSLEYHLKLKKNNNKKNKKHTSADTKLQNIALPVYQ